MLDGLVALNPDLTLLQGGAIVVRADAEAIAARGEVALISGVVRVMNPRTAAT